MNETIEAELIRVFDDMERVCRPYRSIGMGSFGRGWDMHDSARQVAPDWLRKWDDDNRWAICFSMSWPDFVRYANAFGVAKPALLATMERYRTAFSAEVPTQPGPAIPGDFTGERHVRPSGE